MRTCTTDEAKVMVKQNVDDAKAQHVAFACGAVTRIEDCK